MEDAKCICKGNWRLIIKKYEQLINRKYIEDRTGNEFIFFGLVHGGDDYYYGMWPIGSYKPQLLSCVGNIEAFGFTLV